MASDEISNNALAAYPQLQKLYEYWRSKGGPERLPARAEIDPTELPGSVWEHLMLLDLVRDDGALHIRLRLTGSHIDRALGHNATGEFMEDALTGDPAYRAYIQALYEELAGSGEPIFSRNVFRLGGQSATMLTTRLSLPLADDHRIVNMALVGVIFEYPREFEPHYGSALQGFTEIVRQRLPR